MLIKSKTIKGIVFFLIILAGVGVFTIVSYDNLELSAYETVIALISLFTSLGALVSATFVVASYLQTNKAYIESQRPHLLIFVDNLKHQETDLPVSKINYLNITNNRFNDLTIMISVEAENRIYDLSYLFRSKMTMIGQDQRQRLFNPIEELDKLGLEVQKTARSGKGVKLKVKYKYSFNGAEDIVNAQEYLWDTETQQWSIC